jgi:predicted GNAT superfamily acetyltransferase
VIVIRNCRGFDELQACVDLQIEVWGHSEGDVIPRRAFLVSQKIGGQMIGAFDVEQEAAENHGEGNASSMVGFAYSLPGVKSESQGGKPEAYLHSHMLAVRDGYRNQRIGARLKLAQRDDALARGISLMEWTFDPLEIKNAFLNIYKLGAVIRRYEENFYGVSSSRLQGGLPTDRLVAEWWIGSERVREAIAGNAPRPGEPGEDHVLTIRVPAEIYDWKASDQLRHKAKKVQTENRSAFQEAFSQGLAVVAYRRDESGDGIYYLGRWSEPGS